MDQPNSSHKPKKVLITGATGLLGRSLMKAFIAEKAQNEDGVVSDQPAFEVLGLSQNRKAPQVQNVDLTSLDALRGILDSFLPDFVIHAAAIRKPDECEANKELTRKLNVDVTRFLAEYCRSRGCCSTPSPAWMIYISTDYVFDGTQSPYKPNAKPNPINFYGQTKLEGEQAIRELSTTMGILRVAMLYGNVTDLKESSVTAQIEPLLDTKKVVEVDDWQLRYPTLADDVANVCVQLVQRKIRHCGIGGTWHWSGTERMTKYEMTVKIAEILNLSHEHIKPVKNPPQTNPPRPYNVQLDCSALEMSEAVQHTSFETGIKEFAKNFHQTLTQNK